MPAVTLSSATLRARKGTIAALTLFATLAFGATFVSVDTASASEGAPVSGPVMTPTPSPTPTTSASPSPSPDTTASPTSTTTTAKPTARQRRAHEIARIMHRHEIKVHKVLREARKQKGKPYVYGADGPHSFDCSGLVRYVFLHALHKSLPHNAAAQYYSIQHIKRSQLRPGDLVFTDNGSITHVGIFAGHHHWWVAPETGTRVQLQRIYSAHFVYGRAIPLRLPKAHHRNAKHHRRNK